MSNEQTKVKVSKRRLKDDNAVRKQVKIAKAHGLTLKDKAVKEPHRLAKHHAMDCGQPGCVMCGNPRHNKLFKKERLTIQERKFFQNMDDAKKFKDE
jgi:hypothetical protein